MFSPNANGVGANVGTALIAPTPLALGLKRRTRGRLQYKAFARRGRNTA